MTITKTAGIWHVQIGAQVWSSRYLDEVLERATPALQQRERDRLQVQLLEWAYRQGATDPTPMPGEAEASA